MIPALVLTAGYATRLRPLSRLRAKAALPVAGTPLIERILRQLAASGVGDAVLNLHHLPDSITKIVGDGTHLGVRVRYSWEVPILGSAGGPQRAVPLLASSAFLIVNGDTLTTFNPRPLAQAHAASGALVTMAVTPQREPQKYGSVMVAEDGAVIGFPGRGIAGPAYHFIGVQAVTAEAFAAVPDNRPAESVTGLYSDLIRTKPGAIRAFVADTEFFDIGTPRDYLDTSLTLAAREARGSTYGARADIAPTATVLDTVLWNDVTVAAGARVERCIIADGVHIPRNASFEGVTLRRAVGELESNEQAVGDLAIAPM
jgi:NDP-sugar pyrophosphorylase family protein